jgi:hypothetical protein
MRWTKKRTSALEQRAEELAAYDRSPERETLRAMRAAALAELRELSGPYSGTRAREIELEIRKYDAWLGVGR